MKIPGRILWICGVGFVLLAAVVVAQETDKQKLIEIEKQFATISTNGRDSAALAKQYYYEGPLVQLTPTGRLGTLPKDKVLELLSKPDPSDPDVKSAQTVADFRVELYGDTALIAYKWTNTDTGHKDPALNATDHFGCLDTFVKQKGQWLFVGNACTRTSPYPAAEWIALKKAQTQEPKEVQDAFH